MLICGAIGDCQRSCYEAKLTHGQHAGILLLILILFLQALHLAT